MTSASANSNTLPQNVIKGPWKITHQQRHRDWHDTFVELMQDFQHTLRDDATIPRLNDGSIDFSRITVAQFYYWISNEATKLHHKHKDKK